MKDIKERIKKILKGQALPLDLIAALCEESEETIKPLLEEMVNNQEIKYSSNLELYKLSPNKHKQSFVPRSKEEVYNCIVTEEVYNEKTLGYLLRMNPKELKALLNELVQEGRLIYAPYYNVYAPALEAKLSVKSQGYAFAKVEGIEEEYYISPDDLADAYDGDICKIFPTGYDDKLKGAAVYQVVKHAHTYVVGKLIVKGKKYPKYKIESVMESFPVRVDVAVEDLHGAYIGAIVTADLIYKGHSIKGVITQVVGSKDDPGIEISEIALEYGFKTPFSEETQEQIESIAEEVKPAQYFGRRDFRDQNIITIDGDDSKDFDDAVYLEILPNGNYSLGVHIADVSEYVTEGSPLDQDALSRGTSVYLADRVIPMLPKKLSNGICSLNEGVDRLTISCIMEIDAKGKLVNYEIVEGVIHSHHRMTYNKVNQILSEDLELGEQYKDIVPMLQQMKELSGLIRGLRYKKGGIEFESEEYKFILNPDGSPKEIHKRVQDTAEKLIEDFMLMANETVAYHMSIMNLPSVYRIHEKPDQEKLHQVFGAISSMKVSVKNIQNDIHPKEIQSLLESVSEHPNKMIIHTMLLRSMMKAKYSENCLGHYGLAMNYYCHFTSPIRRYPDLMVHRMLKKLYLHPGDLDADIRLYSGLIPDIAKMNSDSERKAVECERAVNDMLYAWHMEKHIQDSYPAVITSITSFGMFASLADGTEGLLAYRNLRGYFDYNERSMSASNGYTTFHLGDKIRVRVAYANRKDRKIDFVLESEE